MYHLFIGNIAATFGMMRCYEGSFDLPLEDMKREALSYMESDGDSWAEIVRVNDATGDLVLVARTEAVYWTENAQDKFDSLVQGGTAFGWTTQHFSGYRWVDIEGGGA